MSPPPEGPGAHNFALLTGGQLLSRLLAFGTTVYLTRVLEPEGFGAIVTSLAILAYAALVVDLGLDALGPLEVARAALPLGRLAGTVVTIRLMVMVPAFALLGVVAWLAPLTDSTSAVLLLYASSLIANALSLHWVFLGTARMGTVAAAEVVQHTAFALGVLLWVDSPERLLRVPVVYLAARLSLVLWLARASRPLLQGFALGVDRAVLRRLWPAGLAFSGSALLAALLQNFDAVLLGLWLGMTAAGSYGAAIRVVWVPTLVVTALMTALRPAMARAVQQGAAAVQTVVDPALRVTAALGAGTAVGGVILAEPIVELLYGAGYHESVLPLKVMLVSFGCLAVSRLYRLLLVAFERQRTDVRIMGAAVAVDVGLNLWLVPRAGPLGAALAALAAEVLILAAVSASAARLVSRPSLYRLFAKPAGCALLLAAALLASQALPVLARIAGGAALYLSLLLLFRAVRFDELRAVLRS